VESSLSLIRFNLVNFFSVLINSRPLQPNSAILIKIVESLISAEPTLDEEMGKLKKRVDWIYENTHEKVNENLAIVELAVYRNLYGKLNREIEIGDNSYTIAELYKYLDEVSKELAIIVIKIGKKYSIDIPLSLYGGSQSQKISLE